MKNKVCFFSIADVNNLKYFKRMEKSLKHFHPDIPLLLWDQAKVESYNDPFFYYRATPIIARQLLKDYDLVIKIDSDSIVTGDLNHIIDDLNYDIAAPLNWNQVDSQALGPVTVWDISPVAYLNCGLVAMRNREFVDKWFRLCQGPQFNSYKYREQDLLNIMAFYMDWKVKNLDAENTWNGLISKIRWPQLVLEEGKLICPPYPNRFPDQKMTVKVLHFAGGNTPGDKFDVINTRFSPEVQEFLKGLIK